MLDVLIAEDDIPVSIHLSNTINTSNVRCIGILNNGTKVYEKTKELKPDILLLDLNMPGKNGLEILKQIQDDKNLSSTRVFIYSGKMEYLALARDYKCVDRFFSKITPPEEISRNLEQISEELSYEKVDRKIREILLKLGFSYTLRGTRYLNDCILNAIINNEEKVLNIYNKIAKEKNENIYTIKSNINTAINNMWRFCDKIKVRQVLRLGQYEKPTAHKIIVMIKYYIEK